MISLDIADLRALYSKGGNIMAAFRQAGGKATNSAEAVKISYDLQSGSYTKAWAESAYRQRHDLYCGEIAGILSSLTPTSLLEAGVGEATTLCSVMSRFSGQLSRIAGFDLSWSRIKFAREHAQHRGFPDLLLCTGSLERIPYPDTSFDVVFTAHAIEPNHGKERTILRELLRVTQRFLVLFEPSYELGGSTTRARIEKHGYCRDLPRLAEEEGGKIVAHRLIDNPMSCENATALLAIEKSGDRGKTLRSIAEFSCPCCRGSLDLVRANRYCSRCATVFPVLDGIPCLLPENGILATCYMEDH